MRLSGYSFFSLFFVCTPGASLSETFFIILFSLPFAIACFAYSSSSLCECPDVEDFCKTRASYTSGQTSHLGASLSVCTDFLVSLLYQILLLGRYRSACRILFSISAVSSTISISCHSPPFFIWPLPFLSAATLRVFSPVGALLLNP